MSRDKTSEQSLDDAVVSQRLAQDGRNVLPMAPPTPARARFLSQFNNVLIYVLIVSAIVGLLLQHLVDSGVIFLWSWLTSLWVLYSRAKPKRRCVPLCR